MAMLGGLVYYGRSKYVPAGWKAAVPRFPAWVGLALVILAAGLYVYQWQWAVGLLIWSLAVPLAYGSVVYLLNIDRNYALGWLAVLVVFLLIDVLN